MKPFPWIRMQRRTHPELPLEPPIPLGNLSNGEFFHEQTPRERRMRDEILRRADAGARRLGIDRRDFLASALGMTTSLAVVNLFSGCSDSSGGFRTPEDPLDCEGATQMLSGNEFIFDIQTHHIEDEETWRERHPGQQFNADGFAQFLTLYQCDLPDRRDCIGPAQYARFIFLESDTTVATLSGFPSPMCDDGTLCTNLNSNDGMAFWRQLINDAAGSQRMVQHCQVAPNDRWDLQAAMMEQIREQYGNHGWKCYPPWGPRGQGWWLDDEAVAGPFIEKCIELGEPLICAHKGFPLPGFDRVHTDPRDVGPAAARYPQVNFVVYHSAFEAQNREGPYDPNGLGVDRLCRTVEEHGLKGKNVYAELGSAWVLSMRNAEGAQHLIGKLVKYLGEDNVLWGSECIWFGSPQPQIEFFRALEISPELQEQYGYPELTSDIKQKIFGLNAARIYGIDPDAVRCTIDESKLGRARRELDVALGTRRWAFQQPQGPRTRREFMALARWRQFLNRPA
ncbi:MAG: amidohydrolase family protein [Thermodesulfobacteriota bacterium]